MNELMRITPGRPSVVKQDQWTVYISVHDQYFKRRLAYLKQLIRDCHPDHRWWTKRVLCEKEGSRPRTTKRWLNKPHSTVAFLIARRMIETFLKEEITYYAQFGLRPPFQEETYDHR